MPAIQGKKERIGEHEALESKSGQADEDSGDLSYEQSTDQITGLQEPLDDSSLFLTPNETIDSEPQALFEHSMEMTSSSRELLSTDADESMEDGDEFEDASSKMWADDTLTGKDEMEASECEDRMGHDLNESAWLQGAGEESLYQDAAEYIDEHASAEHLMGSDEEPLASVNKGGLKDLTAVEVWTNAPAQISGQIRGDPQRDVQEEIKQSPVCELESIGQAKVVVQPETTDFSRSEGEVSEQDDEDDQVSELGEEKEDEVSEAEEEEKDEETSAKLGLEKSRELEEVEVEMEEDKVVSEAPVTVDVEEIHDLRDSDTPEEIDEAEHEDEVGEEAQLDDREEQNEDAESEAQDAEDSEQEEDQDSEAQSFAIAEEAEPSDDVQAKDNVSVLDEERDRNVDVQFEIDEEAEEESEAEAETESLIDEPEDEENDDAEDEVEDALNELEAEESDVGEFEVGDPIDKHQLGKDPEVEAKVSEETAQVPDNADEHEPSSDEISVHVEDDEDVLNVALQMGGSEDEGEDGHDDEAEVADPNQIEEHGHNPEVQNEDNLIEPVKQDEDHAMISSEDELADVDASDHEMGDHEMGDHEMGDAKPDSHFDQDEDEDMAEVEHEFVEADEPATAVLATELVKSEQEAKELGGTLGDLIPDTRAKENEPEHETENETKLELENHSTPVHASTPFYDEDQDHDHEGDTSILDGMLSSSPRPHSDDEGSSVYSSLTSSRVGTPTPEGDGDGGNGKPLSDRAKRARARRRSRRMPSPGSRAYTGVKPVAREMAEHQIMSLRNGKRVGTGETPTRRRSSRSGSGGSRSRRRNKPKTE